MRSKNCSLYRVWVASGMFFTLSEAGDDEKIISVCLSLYSGALIINSCIFFFFPHLFRYLKALNFILLSIYLVPAPSFYWFVFLRCFLVVSELLAFPLILTGWKKPYDYENLDLLTGQCFHFPSSCSSCVAPVSYFSEWYFSNCFSCAWVIGFLVRVFVTVLKQDLFLFVFLPFL